MVADWAKREYGLGFAPDRVMKFESLVDNKVGHVEEAESYFNHLAEEGSKIVKLFSAFSKPNPLPQEMCYVSLQGCFLSS
jgi:hypothetical protein